MPTYPFRCPSCGTERESIRRMSESADSEICGCGAVMERLWTPTQFNMPVPFTGYYNHALGCEVNSKRDIDEAKRKYKDQNGSELIEVGTEDIKGKYKPAPKREEYVLPRGVMDA